jgi:hypothetical protein
MGRLKSSSLQKVQCILNEGQNGGQVDQELRMSSGKKKGSRYFLPGKRHSSTLAGNVIRNLYRGKCCLVMICMLTPLGRKRAKKEDEIVTNDITPDNNKNRLKPTKWKKIQFHVTLKRISITTKLGLVTSEQ